MAEAKEHHVPMWDGSARSWRRYTKEVAWFVQGTPVHKRRYCATRLMGRLTGPARLLAMSWPQQSFDSADGTLKLLRRLAKSPLVRKSLPNAAAICMQYFSFKRNPGESIGNFLVRETLVHEEFVEALIRLHEEKVGISQDLKDFGLPDSVDENQWWYDWYEYDDDGPDGISPSREVPPDVPSHSDPPEADGDGQDLPQRDGPSVRASAGSSPSNRGGAAEAGAPTKGEDVPQAIDEMSIADSFIMGVLRGWRLLQAAGLNSEEKRDILGSTKNSLDYEVISSALQTLWDEQLLGHRSFQSHHQGFTLNTAEYDAQYHDETWQDPDSEWWNYDSYYAYDDDDWWGEDWEQESAPTTVAAASATTTDDVSEDPQLREAQQAEKIAESLALDAQRTWSEAQRATQALKKDRGFGAMTSSSTSGVRCFNCGGSHYARDCPDRRHPGFWKGKGKHKGMLLDYDFYEGYYINKGKASSKSKSKGKGKKGAYLEAQAQWMKGKGKNTGYGPPFRSVNAYGAFDMHLGGLEVIQPTMDLAATTSTPTRPEMGMLDSGATASAAPEAVIQGLISSILEQDRSAKIEVDSTSRPYFRFGDGRWGRALYKTQLSSDVSGVVRKFSLYALPNPPSYYQPGFDKNSLVPILVGMDFLGEKGSGMAIDFSTGLAMSTFDDTPDIFQLKNNSKGHFLLDIRYHLTRGFSRQSGHAHVKVTPSSKTSLPSEEVHVLDLHVVQFDMTVCDSLIDEQEMRQSRERLRRLQEASLRLRAAAPPGSMCGPCGPAVISTTLSSTSLCDGNPHASTSANGNRKDSSGQPQGEGQGEAAGSLSSSTWRSSGPSCVQEELAVLRQPHCGQSSVEQLRQLDPLCRVRLPDSVRTPPRGEWTTHGLQESPDGGPLLDSVEASHGRTSPDGQDCEGNAGQDRRGGDAPGLHQRGEGDWHPLDGDSDNLDGQNYDQSLEDRGDYNELGNGRRRGRAVDRRISSARTTRVKASRVQPLTHYLGKRVMTFVALMTSTMSTMLLGLQLSDRDGLWEMACSPHSWLSECAQQHGLSPRRINLHQGYDLYRPDTWAKLRELRRLHRPRRLWISLPCTRWCQWSSLNYRTPDQKEVLESYRRRERRMLNLVVDFLVETLEEDPEVLLYWEWPWPCEGWKQQPLQRLAKALEGMMLPWLQCRVDGCAYGLRDQHDQGFLKKPWAIRTNDELFHKTFKAKLCPGNHTHVHIQGEETARSAYYPWKMVQAFTRHWRDQQVPARHLRLLESSYNVADLDLEDEETETVENDDLLFEEAHVSNEVNSVQAHEDPEYDILGQAEYVTIGTLFRTALAHKDFSWSTLSRLLCQLQEGMRQQHTQRGRWSATFRSTSRCSLVLGSFVHGGFLGVTKNSHKYKEVTKYINAYMSHHLGPARTWSSLMLGFNTPAVVHTDNHNLRGSLNVVHGAGEYHGGGLWLQGESSDGRAPVRRRLPNGCYATGYLLPTKNQFVEFDPHVPHASERWSGNRIIVSAYTTRMTSQLLDQDRDQLRELLFPLPVCHLMVQTSEEQTVDSQGQVVNPLVVKEWEAKIAKFHKAAGHPTNRNLAKILKDGGHDSWKIQIALNHKCPACESIRPGGTSSGQIPPASTGPMYKAWQAVAIDAAEWVVPQSKVKVKFLLFTDLATKLRVVHVLQLYPILEMRTESADDVIRSFSERWLGTFPKPQVVVLDAANTFTSEKFHEFLSSLNILPHVVADKEPWAHGTAEAAVQDVKHTATAIHLESRDQDPWVTLHLAVSALNSTEYTAGYSSFQWAFGQQYSISDEDVRTFSISNLPTTSQSDFTRLVQARQRAEEVARRTKAQRVLTKLANTTVRQPLRQFQDMELVKIWRKLWPADVHQGPRGGLKKSGRPHWVGPGRVVFHEVLPHQDPEDHRRHLVWVLIGTQLYRCSVHSVRPVTETERFEYETSGAENPTRWKTLADVLPRREYVDVVPEEPDENEVEIPDLPQAPDKSTIQIPTRRVTTKTPSSSLTSTRPQKSPARVMDGEDDPGNATSTATSSTPARPLDEVNEYELPDPKRRKEDEQVNWVEQLHVEAEQEQQEFDLYTAMDETNEFLRIEFTVEPPSSNRQRKLLERSPVTYMVKKMRDSEVSIAKLPAHERSLFGRAKAKEVDSFIKNEAVRKCLNDKEIAQAYDSKRIVKARWVLTWKLVPPEDREEAIRDAKENPDTVHARAGDKKAKARIVLLGFQHPNLLDKGFKTASPVQSSLGRNLLYVMSAQRQWEIEGLDLATAFLQTMPTEADAQLWTTGVDELRQALGVGPEGILRILRNIYGSTTAPRGLWLDLHKTLTQLGATPVLGERCLWAWFSKERKDQGHPLTIGAMGGHVDDFHRVGDNSEEWMAIKQKVNSAYRWGTIKNGNYRHAGTDIATHKEVNGKFYLTVDQEYYVEALEDLTIDASRLRQEGILTPQEVGACRTALGALQWLAIQSQPQLCARCNLLLTEVVTSGTLSTAREIQAMIGEIRREHFALKFFPIPSVKHWSDLVFISSPWEIKLIVIDLVETPRED